MSAATATTGQDAIGSKLTLIGTALEAIQVERTVLET